MKINNKYICITYIIFIFLYFSSINVTFALDLQDWQYSKNIEINNTGEILTEYQIGLLVDTQSLISSHKLKSDGSDLLFVDSDGITLLPFWNETAFNLVNTKIWVKVPSIPDAVNKTIYMYYGNPSANFAADGTQTFEFFENNFLMPLDNNATYLNTPTYDGSGQAVHPDIYYDATGWNGYKYWMVMTPYPYGHETYENPSILVSNDGYSWIVPPELTNPIDPWPGTGRENCDPDLVFNTATNNLEVYYLEIEQGSLNDTILKRKLSSDGSAWSSEEDLLIVPNYHLQSPSIIQDASVSDYSMWYVNAGTSGCGASSSTVEYRSSSDGVSWSGPVIVNITQPGMIIWHVDVSYIPSKNEYWMVYAAYPIGSTCGNTDLYFAKSTDEFNWITYDSRIIGRGPAYWDSTEIYRSTFLYESSTDLMRVWYSARGGSDWHIGYSERNYTFFTDALRWSRTGDTGSSTTNPRNGAYGLRQVGSISKLPVHKLSQLTNSNGSYSYNIWYKDELATDSSYLAALTLMQGATFSNIGVYTTESNSNYAMAISGSYVDTGIARTAGWHNFEMRVNTSGTSFLIDGEQAGSTALITSITSVTPSIDGFSSGTAYYDDFYIRKFTYPEPIYSFKEDDQELNILGFAPASPVNDINDDSRTFNITVNQIADVTWYINGTPVQYDYDVTDSMYTNTSAKEGVWNVSAVATNPNGSIMQTWLWTVTPVSSEPSIIDYSPASPVTDPVGSSRTFDISIDQSVNVTWYINGTPVQSNSDVTNSMYTNSSAANGIWNVSAVTVNTNGSTMQTWLWIVTSSDFRAFWKFDENSGIMAFDSSSNDNDGTISGATWTSGKSGSALSFDGVNDYVSVGSDSSLNIVDAITIEAWVKTTSNNEITVVGRGSSQSDHSFHFAVENGYPVFIFANGYSMTTGDLITGSKQVNDGIWHHIVGRFNGSTIEIYVDGEYDSGILKTTKPFSNNDIPTNIGVLGGYSTYFDGTIDEVKIYARALTASEIQASYNEQSPVTPYIIDYSPVSPVADIVGSSRTFNISVDKTVNVTWYINGTPVQSDPDVTNSIYTNNSAAEGTWNISAIASNPNGSIMQTWLWTVTPVSSEPSIIDYSPASPVDDTVGSSRSFNISIDQSVDVAWYINGTPVQSDSDVTDSMYTNSSAADGNGMSVLSHPIPTAVLCRPGCGLLLLYRLNLPLSIILLLRL